MREYLFFDTFGVPKSVLVEGEGVVSVDSSLVDSEVFCKRVILEPTSEGRVTICRALLESGERLPLSFREKLQERIERGRKFGVEFELSTNNEFKFLGEGKESERIKEEDRKFFEKLTNNLKDLIVLPIHYQKSGANSSISIPKRGVIEGIDAVGYLRYGLKRTSEELGRTITFIPKPKTGERGVGFNIELYLSCEKKISQSFLAGALLHAPEYVALTNGCANSYLRLSDSNCPHFVAWGESEDALIRAEWGESGVRLTLSFPDASTNPYLVACAILEGGLLGIEQNAVLMDTVREFSPQNTLSLVRLPLCLLDGLKICESSGFLKRIMGEGAGNVYFSIKSREGGLFTEHAREEDYWNFYSSKL